jgi:hypothetical protein
MEKVLATTWLGEEVMEKKGYFKAHVIGEEGVKGVL